MFVAAWPTPAALDDLEEFLLPRQQVRQPDLPPLRWSAREQWHVTLAFMPQVADRHLDDLEARLAQAARRRTPFEVRLATGGAFPDPVRAKVLYVGLDAPTQPTQPAVPSRSGSPDASGLVELAELAAGARSAAARAGAAPDGGRFRAHVTVARSGPPIEATRWLRVLDAYVGPVWPVEEIALVASHLGEGPRRRPRYEVVSTFALGPRVGTGSVHLAETRG